MKTIFIICIAVISFSANAQKNDSATIVIKNVGQQINSAFDDYAPVISADGSLLIYTSKRPFSEEEIKKQKSGLENIYSSEFKNKQWQPVKMLPFTVNGKERNNNSALAISNDGQHLFLYRDDNKANGDIWESFLNGVDWSEPTKMPEPINSSKHESSVSISPDGNTIYFVSDRSEGVGGRDIWYCTKDQYGNFGAAQNIGTVINTKGDEEGVFIHPDGKTLYFSSTGHGGVGQYDIFKSVMEKGNWSKPENLGEPINTPEDDLFFVMAADGKRAYYSSSFQKDNFGKKDIYEIDFIPIKKEKGPSLTLIKGIVTDSISGTPIEAKIEIFDNQKNKRVSEIFSNSATGNYLVSLPAGKNYNITISAKGYLFFSDNITLSDTSAFKEIIKNVKLNKIDVGKRVVLKNIFFDFGKTALRTESYVELTNLIKLLEKNPKLKIEISGHTDNVSSAGFNQSLSEERAQAVVSYIVSKGIEIDRLRFEGYGFRYPIATNETEEGKQLNRRVEFKVLETGTTDPNSQTIIGWRTYKKSDFLDGNGATTNNGFYVIIGTFGNKKNAEKFQTTAISKGYENVRMVQNQVTKAYNISVFQTNSKDDATDELTRYKDDYPDVWILKLE